MKSSFKFATLLTVAGLTGFLPAGAWANDSGQCHCQNKDAMMQSHHQMAMGGSEPDNAHPGMTGMGGSAAKENGRHSHEWMQNRQQHLEKMVAKLKAMESDLNQKLADMNQATGRDKISDMAAVLNEMVHQRDEVIDHIVQMQEHHLAWIQHHRAHFDQNAMGGAEQNNPQSSQESHGHGSSFEHSAPPPHSQG